MGCGTSTVAPAAYAGGGTSLTRQLTAAIDRTSKSTRVSTLQREAIEEADALLPEYMRLGVAVEWLREFVREHKIEKETTREVSLKMSAALAEGAELANIEAVQQQQPGMVSRATHFVSHAQNCSFRHLVDSLSIFEAQCESRNSDGGLAPMGRFYWLDIMSVRQKAVASDIRNIGLLIGSMGQLVLVIEPWHEPLCLTRVWCLCAARNSAQFSAQFLGAQFSDARPARLRRYELLEATRSGAKLQIAMSKREHKDFAKTMKELSAAWEGKADRLPFSVNVDVEHAEATIAADRENILRLIRQDLGASKLNAVIAKAMTGALTDAGKRESMVGASSKPRGGGLK